MTNRVIVHASLSIDIRAIEWKKEVEDRNNKWTLFISGTCRRHQEWRRMSIRVIGSFRVCWATTLRCICIDWPSVLSLTSRERLCLTYKERETGSLHHHQSRRIQPSRRLSEKWIVDHSYTSMLLLWWKSLRTTEHVCTALPTQLNWCICITYTFAL